jgi:tetratricopeptide (TPR) repeat protein
MEGRALYTPQRLFGEVATSSDVLAHEPFLERARRQREQDLDQPARLALGAYVVARLIDKLLTLDPSGEALEAFRWQLEAVRRHVTELPSEAPETAHLRGVVEAISAGGRPSSNLSPSLKAYAYFLEHEGRLEESLEALRLAARSQGPETPAQDFTAYALFAGRLNRQLALWEAASVCYGAAEEAASTIGDSFSMLRGRLGRGAVHRGQGNYPAARAAAESVLLTATELQLSEAQAMAYSDLGAIYSSQGLRLEALDADYHAFRLSAETPQRMRALGNLGTGLSEIGAFEAARLAFRIVVESSASVEVRANALLELMDLEASVGNRVAFERHRAAVEEFRPRMSPRMSVDHHYKLAVGLARFGQTMRALPLLKSALDIAERHQLNAWYFKIEQTLKELAERGKDSAQPREATKLSEAPEIREMEIGLREFAGMAAT